MGLSLPRDGRYVSTLRKVTESILADLQAPPAVIDDLRLALGEACANVVRHAAGAHEYRVLFDIDDEGCRIEVADPGPGISLEEAELALPDSTTESGRGIALMRELADELEYLPSEEGTRLRLRKSWDSGSPAAH